MRKDYLSEFNKIEGEHANGFKFRCHLLVFDEVMLNCRCKDYEIDLDNSFINDDYGFILLNHSILMPKYIKFNREGIYSIDYYDDSFMDLEELKEM